MKYTEASTTFHPNPLTNSSFDDIKFETTADPLNAGYVSAVDEIWLPRTKEIAEKSYLINDSITIRDTLKRAVSQVVLHIKRTSDDAVKRTPFPFPKGRNIMEQIKEVKMDINGVGKYITIAGGFGSEKTLYSSKTATEITGEGFARFDGPLVFPNGTGKDTDVNITITPIDNSPYPIMTNNVKGLLERNKKLVITLWMTSTYKFVNIEVKIEPISKETDGDSGIWE